MNGHTIFTINDTEYKFVNKPWSTRYSWGHTSALFIDGILTSGANARYYNRTWESYQYQSCMVMAIDNLISTLLTDYINEYKEREGIKRLTAERRKPVQARFRELNADLYELKASL